MASRTAWNSEKRSASANLHDVLRLLAALRRWALAVIWAAMPLLCGPAFDAALSRRVASFGTVASLGLWIAWALTLVAMLVPRAVTLTVVRIVVPASLLGSAWAVLATTDPDWRNALALGVTALATVVVLAAATGDAFVNGSSYGAERRFALRPPGPLLFGPIELAWAACVVGAVAGPLLLGAHAWIAGAIAVVVGWPAAVLAGRTLHRLSTRWLVFVPAGAVLVDPLTLGDALLMQRRHLARIGLATSGDVDGAEDLTAGALGVALHAKFNEPQPVLTAAARRAGASLISSQDIDAVLFAPTRPGAVLREARDRRLPVT
jgi:hypothetical protein